MPRRNPALVTNEVYHVYNRGVEKRDVFLTDRDYSHFLDTLEHYLTPTTKLSRKSKRLKTAKDNKYLVEIFCFCLMPNHFHLLIKQKSNDGISIFMNRVSNSFTKYFNTKNERVGPLFQGRFKAVRIENDEQLLHLSRYIHLNPLVSSLVNDLRDYKWSSYHQYSGLENSQNTLEGSEEILSHFPSKESYRRFVLDQADYSKALEQIKHQTLD